MEQIRQYKAEPKRILDLMINSIYTNKEIFLRELISNASDALDKLFYLSLIDDSIVINRTNLRIEIKVDEKRGIISITDNGIGMNLEDIESNLGTIGKGGIEDLVEQFQMNPSDLEIIGKFGVGFYSAFMVSEKVVVETRKANDFRSYEFSSKGIDGYHLKQIEQRNYGSTVHCYIKQTIKDDEDYTRFLNIDTIKELVKKHSNYIRYPIILVGEDGEKIEILNSMIPIWNQTKADLSERDYHTFYKNEFDDVETPSRVIHMKTEGIISFSAVLFIPKKAPLDFYKEEYEKGLQLYSKSVFIMNKASELIGDHFAFVKGIVDSPDLSLNISREMLQHNRELQRIASSIDRKIRTELLTMLGNEREAYEEFWKVFGNQIKYSIFQNPNNLKRDLQDLLIFTSAKKKRMISLDEYVRDMPLEQKEIYYVSGSSIAKCEAAPQGEHIKEKGFDILYFTQKFDELIILEIKSYKGKQFKSITQSNLDIVDEKEKEVFKQKEKSYKDITDYLKSELKEVIFDVRITSRLETYPVCFVNAKDYSIEIQKKMNELQNANSQYKEKLILEINTKHELFDYLRDIIQYNPERASDIAWLLYDQACVLENMPIKEPKLFSERLTKIMMP